MTSDRAPVVVVGAGIGGLTLTLALAAEGIPVTVVEAADEIRELGVGINVLPHATKVLGELGALDDLESVAVPTSSAAFFNRFGQLIYSEPLGRAAGYDWPQLSIHRGKLQAVLLAHVRTALGRNAVRIGRTCTGITPRDGEVVVHTADPSGQPMEDVAGRAAIGCDGVHSTVRDVLFPGVSSTRYSGVHMWRGTTTAVPVLDGATMIRAGWLATGKMVIYPISRPDRDGRQLINWVAEVERKRIQDRDWNRRGRLEDFIEHFEAWTFEWLDVPKLLADAHQILEYPMVDQHPLPRWSVGRVTLLGDAAHPMVPRGSNGAGQAILDARRLADELAADDDVPAALAKYEAVRRPATTRVVEMNNSDPPDAILRIVWERTGDQPFEAIDDVVSSEELLAVQERYKAVAGYSHADLR